MTAIMADHEFEPLRSEYPMLNTCARGEHVPEVERYIRTIKDATRSTYRLLPYRTIPRLVLSHLVKNAVFWLNAFPSSDGVSSSHSPRYFLTGRELEYDKHAVLEFGQYVQSHEEHTNDMRQRAVGAICLGPTGNHQGAHWFMCLTSGQRIIRYRWTSLPAPQEVIQRVEAMGRQQNMPNKVTYANRYGDEIEDTIMSHDWDSDDETDDETYEPSDAETTDYQSSSDGSESLETEDGSDTDDDDDGSHGDHDHPDHGISESGDRINVDCPDRPEEVPIVDVAPDREQPPSVATNQEPPRRSPRTTTQMSGARGVKTEAVATRETPVRGRVGRSISRAETASGCIQPPAGISLPQQTTGVSETIRPSSPGTTGVGEAARQSSPGTTGVNEASHESIARRVTRRNASRRVPRDMSDDESLAPRAPTTEHEQFVEAQRRGRKRATQPDTGRRTRSRTGDLMGNHYVFLTGALKQHNRGRAHGFKHLLREMDELGPRKMLEMLEQPSPEAMYSFLTEQMSASKGLKKFGRQGAEAVKKELEQLVYRKVMHGKPPKQMNHSERRAALRYLMFLKQKRCGKIKARGCADGRKQRIYKSKSETSSPTIHTESLFLSSIIDAMERRNVATVDIPGAFMQADIDEIIHVKLVGDLARLLIRVDPSYERFVVKEKGKPVIYTELDKALYGTLQAALLFWEDLSGFLIEELGFVANPYDSCVVNRTIRGKQMTIGWHVDDLKISHVDQAAIDDIIKKLESRYGKETPLTVTRGNVHEYLGMKIDYSQKGKVRFSMPDYIDRMLEDVPSEIMRGPSATPASNHLFRVNPDADNLDTSSAIMFHHLTAQLLYLGKRTRPDLLTAVSFLCTRVQNPDVDDWKKLGRCLRFVRDTKQDVLTLEADNATSIIWWVDASYGVHHDLKSHTGATMTMGRGSPISISSKQKINTRSSTEAELVGVNDVMYLILWVRHFLESQGYKVTDNIVYQDNESAMLLERNGKRSSGKNTRHIEIRYFFVTDNIKRNKLSVEYCPTDTMLGDYYTKPTQGRKYKWQREKIMNLAPEPNTDSQECVGAPGQTEPARARGAMGTNAPESLMSSWTSRRLSKRSLKAPQSGPEARGVTDPGPSGLQRPVCAKSRASRGRAPPAHEETRAPDELVPREQSHRNAPNSKSLSHRFGSYLEVAKRALNRGRNRSFSLC